MNSEEKATKGCFYTLIAGILLSVMVNVFLIKFSQEKPSVVVEHDTVWKDTIIREPLPAETIQTGRVVYIKVPVPDTQGTGTAELSKDSTGASQSTCVADSIEVPVPIVQKRYDDSLYTAWVSGFEPALDSINIHQREVVTTVTKTIVKPSPLITFGIQAGAGFGVINKRPDIFIGVGGQVNLWRK